RRAVASPAVDRPLLLHRRRHQPHSARGWRPALRPAFDRPLDRGALANLLPEPPDGDCEATHHRGGRLQSSGPLARREPARHGVLAWQADRGAGDRALHRHGPRPGARLARGWALRVTGLVAGWQGAGLLRTAGPDGPFSALVASAPGDPHSVADRGRLTGDVGKCQSILERGPHSDTRTGAGAGDRGCRSVRDLASRLVLSKL